MVAEISKRWRILGLLSLAALLAGALLALVRRDAHPPPRRYARIDMHVHAAPETIPELLTLLSARGIERAVNLSGGPVGSHLLDEQLAAAAATRGRVLVFCNLGFKGILGPGWVDRQLQGLREARAAGARGLKISKALGLGLRDPQGDRIPVDDPRLDPLFELAGELEMPVAIHTGDPKAFFRPPTPDNERFEELSLNPKWSFFGPEYPSWEQLFGELMTRVGRHPRTTFISVHFGNDPEEPERVGELLDRYPNLYVDTAARIGEIGRADPARLRALFIRHRTRVLFGTDLQAFLDELVLGAPEPKPPTRAEIDRFFTAHWLFFETSGRGLEHPTPIQGNWKVNGIELPSEVLEDLYHRNAERLLRWETPPGSAGVSPAGTPPK